MWKLIFLGLIIWFAIYIFKRVVYPTNINQSGRTQAPESSIEDMVQCATCRVHLPRSEAFLVSGNFYCSKAHIANK